MSSFVTVCWSEILDLTVVGSEITVQPTLFILARFFFPPPKDSMSKIKRKKKIKFSKQKANSIPEKKTREILKRKTTVPYKSYSKIVSFFSRSRHPLSNGSINGPRRARASLRPTTARAAIAYWGTYKDRQPIEETTRRSLKAGSS